MDSCGTIRVGFHPCSGHGYGHGLSPIWSKADADNTDNSTRTQQGLGRRHTGASGGVLGTWLIKVVDGSGQALLASLSAWQLKTTISSEEAVRIGK